MPVLKKKHELAGICSIRVPLYGGFALLSLDKEQHTRIMDYMKIENSQRPDDDMFETTLGFAAEYTNTNGEHSVVVQVNDHRLDTLVHELAHAAFMICDYRGIETDRGKREAYAYLIDHLFAEFYPPTTKRWQLEEDKRDAEKKAKKKAAKAAKEKKNDSA